MNGSGVTFWLVDTRELLAPDIGAPLGRSRGRVLELLRTADTPLTVADVARRCGLHQNTARFHLDALVAAGLAARDPGLAARDPGPGPGHGHAAPGRPAIGYRASADGAVSALPGERRYRLLAEMMTSLVAALADNPAATAERAGREWGGYLTEPPLPYRRPSAAEALSMLTGLLADLGFDPEAEPCESGETERARRLVLRECPFREVAREHQAVVCSLHLGVIRGALDRMRAPLAADRLEVFPEPGLCRVRLTIPECA
jgi:predicted ArsR family transcriptional regulator